MSKSLKELVDEVVETAAEGKRISTAIRDGEIDFGSEEYADAVKTLGNLVEKQRHAMLAIQVRTEGLSDEELLELVVEG